MNNHSNSTKEGTIFYVPVATGFAVGVIARSGNQGTCLGYFFGPLVQVKNLSVSYVKALRFDNAIYTAIFSADKLKKGLWTTWGIHPNWQRCEWPIPVFSHQDVVNKKHFLRFYDDALNFVKQQERLDVPLADLPKDGYAYSGFVELRLAHLLGEKTTEPDPYASLPESAADDPPQHYLYFHDEELAKYAGEEVRKLGFDPAVILSVGSGSQWLLLARHPENRLVAEEQMEQEAEQLEKMAEELGGEYDGWDKPS